MMRLQQVLDLLNGGGWYNHIQYRLNPPDGVFIHWSRAVDILLLSLTLPLSLLLPTKTALLVAAALIPPAFFAICCKLLTVGMRALGLTPQEITFALLVSVLTPVMAATFGPFSIDHHFLLDTLSVAMLTCGLIILKQETTDNKKISTLMGVVVGLGVWVSPEFLMIASVCLFYIGCCWLGNPERYREVLPRCLTAALCVITFAMVCERWPTFSVEHDTVSIVHVTLFALLTAVAWGLYKLRGYHSAMARFQAAVLGFVVAMGVMYALFPGFENAHFNHVSPFVYEHLLRGISEMLPLLLANEGKPIILACHLYLFLLVAVMLFLPSIKQKWRERGTQYFFLFFYAVAVLYMALQQQRWLHYATPAIAMVAAGGVGVWLENVRALLKNHKFLAKVAVCLLLILLAVGNLIIGMIGLAHKSPKTDSEKALASCTSHIKNSIRDGSLGKHINQPAGVILGSTDLAPDILFFTSHKAVAGNYHRDSDGIKTVFDFYAATTFIEAKKIIDKHHVDLVVFCEGDPFYIVQKSADSVFFKAIHDKKPEPWFSIIINEKQPLLRMLVIQK